MAPSSLGAEQAVDADVELTDQRQVLVQARSAFQRGCLFGQQVVA
jgi:hypothetical protein